MSTLLLSLSLPRAQGQGGCWGGEGIAGVRVDRPLKTDFLWAPGRSLSIGPVHVALGPQLRAGNSASRPARPQNNGSKGAQRLAVAGLGAAGDPGALLRRTTWAAQTVSSSRGAGALGAGGPWGSSGPGCSLGGAAAKTSDLTTRMLAAGAGRASMGRRGACSALNPWRDAEYCGVGQRACGCPAPGTEPRNFLAHS